MITQPTIDRIFDEVRIEDIVSEFVPLKKAGSNLKGLSPWNSEKTPSFFVSPSKNIFKDFSSGKGGNAVTFLMELESMTYPEALKYIAAKYGIEVEESGMPEKDAEEVSLRESLALVNRFAFEYFEKNLWESDEGKQIGLSYFRERGFTDGTVKTFSLGYAFDENDAFLKAAEAAGHNPDHLLTLGLVKEGNYGRYDFFRGRVIFPIRNVSGRPIAFAGRTLKSDNKVKYLNSPESELYNKSKVLYGLFEAKRAIGQNDCCLLTEGYTDVISLHQAGVDYAVASSGTSLTEDQVKLIKRYTKNVTVLYDGDSAGVKAAMRGIDLLLKEGMQVKVVFFPDGHDPDSFARSVSQEVLERYLKEEAKDFIDFFLEVLLPEEQAEDPGAKTAATRRIVDSLALISDHIARSVYVEKCAKRLNLAAQVLHTEINKILRSENRKRAYNAERDYDPGPQAPSAPPQALPENDGPQARLIKEAEVMRILLVYGNAELKLDLVSEDGTEEEVTVPVAEYVLHELFTDGIQFTSEAFAEIIERFDEHHKSTGSFPETSDFVRDHKLSTAVAELVAEPYLLSENWAAKHRIFTESEAENLKRAAFDPLIRIKLQQVVKLIKDLDAKLKETAPLSDDNSEELTLLMQEKMRLNEIKSDLSKYFGTVIL